MEVSLKRTRRPSMAFYAEYTVLRDSVELSIQITKKPNGRWAAWRKNGECVTDASTLADIKRNLRELLEKEG